jgi:hypothetical protein
MYLEWLGVKTLRKKKKKGMKESMLKALVKNSGDATAMKPVSTIKSCLNGNLKTQLTKLLAGETNRASKLQVHFPKALQSSAISP